MITNEEMNRLQRVARRCAIAAARIVPADVAEDASQEAWARFLRVCLRDVLRTEHARTAYFVGIFQKVCADAVRKWKRRREVVALESEVGDGLPEALASPLKGGEDQFESLVRRALRGLADADIDLWLAAKVERTGWKAAGEAAGMEKSEVVRARQRILRFLSTRAVVRRFLDALGLEDPPIPRSPDAKEH